MIATPKFRLQAALATLVLSSACTDAPDEPTWGDEVVPILAANCVRCHAYPPTGGAPDTFRLDVWQDTFADDGRRILGAGNMAEFAAARARKGDMPPRLELTGRQKKILDRWVAQRDSIFDPAPAGPPRELNRPPQAVLEGTVDVGDKGNATAEVFVNDPDRDLVVGQLELHGGGDVFVVTRELTTGRRTYEFDVRSLPADTVYSLVARISDHPAQELSRTLATNIRLDGVAAPNVLFLSPPPYGAILGGTTEIEVLPSSTEEAVINLQIEAIRGTERIAFFPEEGLQVDANMPVTIPWDTTAASSGSGWRLRATVRAAGGATFDAEVGKITIAQTESALTFDDVAGNLATNCGRCHPGGSSTSAPGTFLDVTRNDGAGGVQAFCGAIYQRLVVEGSMPPTSASYLFSGFDGPSDSERAQLREWLEAGCPE